MKYMVMVNQKYLVMVEAQSAGGAEHKILDNVYYGIDTCQAFSMSELSTDFFRGCAENCETISYSELFDKAKEYKRIQEAIEAEKTKIAETKKQIEEMEERIRLAESSLSIRSANMKDLSHQISAIF